MPQVCSQLSTDDHLGTIGARTGYYRNNYKITPGLYAIGQPSPNDPVIVTANYKLTFDTVRKALSTLNLWILVIDTRGINVWCAAGKGTFSTKEIAYQIQRCQLSERVHHKTIIIPQLSAPGVSVVELKKECGFRGIYGPVRIADLPAFLANEMEADEPMRSVTFTLGERLSLIPVEICTMLKTLAITLLAATLMSGIGPYIFSPAAAISRGLQILAATSLAIFAGSLLTPALLPWIPGRQFWLKGALVAIPFTMFLMIFYSGLSDWLTPLALSAWVFAISSYLAMKFTGSTPYTSLAGVEAEMRRGLPFQIFFASIAVSLWLIKPFV